MPITTLTYCSLGGGINQSFKFHLTDSQVTFLSWDILITFLSLSPLCFYKFQVQEAVKKMWGGICSTLWRLQKHMHTSQSCKPGFFRRDWLGGGCPGRGNFGLMTPEGLVCYPPSQHQLWQNSCTPKSGEVLVGGMSSFLTCWAT